MRVFQKTALLRGGGSGGTGNPGGGGDPTVDPYWNDVVFYFESDGADGSTTFSDRSNSNHTVSTGSGTPEVDQDITLLEEGTALFATGERLQVASHADFHLEFLPFTIEAAFRFSSIASVNTICGRWGTNNSERGYWLRYDDNTGELRFTFVDDDLSFKQLAGAWSPSVDTDYFVAVDRDLDGTFRLYVGAPGAVCTMLDSLTELTVQRSVGSAFAIGTIGGITNDFVGNINMVRVTHEARYASDAGFTARSTAYPTVQGFPSRTVSEYTHTETPATNPASTLTDFVEFFDASKFPQDFWDNIKGDGGDLRVYNASDAQIPFHLFGFDLAKQRGIIAAKQTRTTGGESYKFEVGFPARSALAASDTYGSDNVWTDYKVACVFGGDLTDSTSGGNDLTLKLGTEYHGLINKVPALVTHFGNVQASVDDMAAGSDVWTMSALVVRTVENGNNQQAISFAQTYGSSSNRRCLGQRNIAGEPFTDFSSDDSWNDGTTGAGLDEIHAIASVYDGTTERILYVDGVAESTDTTITGATMDTFVVGGGNSSGANWRGLLALVLLRYDKLSADWIAYHHTNLDTIAPLTS